MPQDNTNDLIAALDIEETIIAHLDCAECGSFPPHGEFELDDTSDQSKQAAAAWFKSKGWTLQVGDGWTGWVCPQCMKELTE